MFKKLQQIGKAFMLPIAILPAAGLLLGIGSGLSNEAALKAYPFLDIAWLQGIFKVMASSGNIIFSNLALLICIGLSLGLAKKDKGTAALAGATAYLVMNGAIAGFIHAFNPQIGSIDTGVVGSIVIAFAVSYLHEKYADVKLPSMLGFFGGSRFIPIISSFCAIFIGFVFFLIWPTLHGWLVAAGKGIAHLGAVGSFFYGFLMRLCGAVGLHHMIYPMFWYTELGGTEMVAGQMVVGAQKIFFAQLADPNHVGLFTEGTRFFAGRFATMMFGLPGACLAMYTCAKSSKKKAVAGLLLGAGLTSFLTGITEPIEFMFLFIAPWLYVIHALLDGISFYIADILNIAIGNSFSGGVIDFLLFGVLQGNAKTNWVLVLLVGPVYTLIYYFLFVFLIKKFNVLTPGREEDETEKVNVVTRDSMTQTAQEIIVALGNKENIEEVDACITRLRVSVKDVKKVNKDELKKLGARGVLEVAGGVQAVFGTMSDPLKQRINALLGKTE